MPYIAVVDDEEPVRKALKRLLRAAGLEAEAFASGEELLAAERPPDCVVLDLHMPLMDGREVLRRIRGRSARPPVVVITAHDTAGTRADCFAVGAAAYLLKPIDDRLLLSAISAALGRALREG